MFMHCAFITSLILVFTVICVNSRDTVLFDDIITNELVDLRENLSYSTIFQNGSSLEKSLNSFVNKTLDYGKRNLQKMCKREDSEVFQRKSSQQSRFLNVNNKSALFLTSKLIISNKTRTYSTLKSKRRPLYIGGLFDLSGERGDALGSSELTAAKLAVHYVNKENILPGYEIFLLVNDTKVRFKTLCWG